ncbi:MAG: glycosyl hydrolase family 18 protein [Clostridia bacterium]|nr:glycosyl hydrolase family 18 protein [Clostridia bacterium]
MKRKLLFLLLFVIFAAVPAFADDTFVPLKVVCNGESLSTGYEYHGNLYITLDDFLKYGKTESFTINSSRNQIFFDPADFDIFIADSKTTEFIKNNAGTVHVSMRGIGSKTYVPLVVLADFAELSYEFEGEKLTLYPAVSTEGLYKVTKTCTVTSSLVKGSGKSYQLSPNSGVFFSIKKDFGVMSLVETINGDTVYIMNDCITSAEASDADKIPVYIYNSKEKADYGRKFNIAWDQNPKASPDSVDGVDVIAPFEWFYPMVGEGGTLGNNANVGYSIEAHANGYRVWATATNAFTTSGSTKFTLGIFQNEELLSKVCAQYLFYCALYDVDGLNIDYEDLYLDGMKAGLTKMMRTLSEYTNRMGLDLSIATLVPESWNLATYDYKALGECCDYVTPMAYDEHYNVASGIGSTSSKGWYVRNMKTLRSYVPSEKILMGVPLYCFVCKTDASGNFVTCTKLSANRVMNNVKAAAKNGKIITGPEWLEDDGQYYVEYVDGDYVTKIWLEDTRSVAQRIACAYDLDLAGTACWSIDHVVNDFFKVFSDVNEGGVDPNSITPAYPPED